MILAFLFSFHFPLSTFFLSTFSLAQWLFIKLIGICYLAAFWSLLVQIKGLWGVNGISPAINIVNYATLSTKSKWLHHPSIFWLNASDTFMQSVAVGGVILSLFVIVGIFPVPCLFLLWIGYISFLTIGSDFLSFQWDTLLVEIGFASIFFAMATPPMTLWILLMWFILFRFMVSSGLVKLMSHCPTWKGLTAMKYHYETQPLPSPVAWYAHQLPQQFGRFSVAAVLVIEIIVPFLIFGPAPLRVTAGILLLFLQFLIVLTGNYAFFNILTVALTVLLFNDSQLSWLLGDASSLPHEPVSLIMQIILYIAGFFLLYVNIVQFASLFVPLGRFRNVLYWVQGYNLCNSYGLFARMTTVRDEIIIEGSDDGETWYEYEFKWKPGDVNEAPRFVAPHQPRLDWQMWFAALGTYHYNDWFIRFMGKLLEGSEDVIGLMEYNPFPDNPPKYIRAKLYNYHFTDMKTGQETGQWWTRTYKGMYCPEMQLKDKG